MPYTAIFDIKPPGIHLLFALPAAFGASAMESWMLVRILDLVFLILGAWLIGRIAARLLDSSLASVVTVWFLVLHLSGQMAGFAQTETWALPFFLFAWWILPVSTKNETANNSARARFTLTRFALTRFALSGLSSGIIFVCKPTSAVPIFGLLLIALWRFVSTKNEKASLETAIFTTAKANLRETFFKFALWILGFALPVLAAIFWLQARGAWPNFVEIWRDFLTPYIESARDPAPGHLLVWVFLSAFYIARFPLPCVLILLGFLARAPWKSGARHIVFAVFAGALVALWMQNRLFEYHLKILLPVAAIVATAGAAEVARLARFSPRRSAIFLFALPAIYALGTRGTAIIAAPLVASQHFPRASWFEIIEKKARVAERDESVAAAGEWMRARARPQDTLMVWGFAPQLYLWSDLKPASRFVYLPPLAASYAPARWKTEFLARFKKQPPRFFVVVEENLKWHGVKSETPARVLREWKSLDSFFTPRYFRAARWPGIEVWQRKK